MQYRFSRSVVTLAFVVLPVVALAAGNSAQKEVSTAHAHALMAQGADSVDMVHTHLHHVINCLVGQDGDAFDADAGNPCDGMGNGALNDVSGNDALHSKLEKALSTAQSGLQKDDLDAAQQAAGKTADTLPEQSSADNNSDA